MAASRQWANIVIAVAVVCLILLGVMSYDVYSMVIYTKASCQLKCRHYHHQHHDRDDSHESQKVTERKNYLPHSTNHLCRWLMLKMKSGWIAIACDVIGLLSIVIGTCCKRRCPFLLTMLCAVTGLILWGVSLAKGMRAMGLHSVALFIMESALLTVSIFAVRCLKNREEVAVNPSQVIIMVPNYRTSANTDLTRTPSIPMNGMGIPMNGMGVPIEGIGNLPPVEGGGRFASLYPNLQQLVNTSSAPPAYTPSADEALNTRPTAQAPPLPEKQSI